jgi:hypothetical protein
MVFSNPKILLFKYALLAADRYFLYWIAKFRTKANICMQIQHSSIS